MYPDFADLKPRGLAGASGRVSELNGTAKGAPMESKDLPTPETGLLLTHFLTVGDVPRSRAFYSDVLGGEVVMAEDPCIVKLANSWLIMNPGGGPTPDKPDVTLHPPTDPHTATSFLNIRVADIDACYREWSARGAEFLTPPIDRKAEVRCYMRDPDGYLIEVGQMTGLLKGIHAGTGSPT